MTHHRLQPEESQDFDLERYLSVVRAAGASADSPRV